MKPAVITTLITILLISGCGTTKVVTTNGITERGISFAPMFDNPTRTDMDSPAFTSTLPDLCLGVSSKINF